MKRIRWTIENKFLYMDSCCKFEQNIKYMNLDQKEWWEGFLTTENAVILDVRTEEEVANGIIPEAINIDIYKGQGFIYQVEELDKEKSYFIYCLAGGRSAQACGIMKQLGFEKVYNLVGGISQWEGPIEN